MKKAFICHLSLDFLAAANQSSAPHLLFFHSLNARSLTLQCVGCSEFGAFQVYVAGEKAEGAHLETHDERLSLNIGEGQVHVAHVALLCALGPIEHHSITLRSDAILQALSHCPDVGCVGYHVSLSNLACCAQADCKRCWDCATSDTALLQQSTPGMAHEVQ